MKPWKISLSSNGAFSGLNNKHLKSLAIRASDCQDFYTGPDSKSTDPARNRGKPIQLPMVVFLRFSSLLNINKYVYGKCRFSIVISCRRMSLLQYRILLFSYSKWFLFRKLFLSELFSLAKTLE